MYHINLKFIGHAQSDPGKLDLVVYRNMPFPVSAKTIDFVIETLRAAISPLRNVTFEETVFLAGDDTSNLTSVELPNTMIGTITFPRSELMPFAKAVSNFGKDQDMLVRFQQLAPDPALFSVTIYSEGLILTGVRSVADQPMSVSAFKAGSHPSSSDAVAQTIAALKQSVEKVPGVTFTAKQ